jgi:high-affinity iron transporter
MMRRVVLAAGLLLLTVLASACSSSGGSGGVSRADGIRELEQTRRSIDRTLDLIKSGQAEQAFEEAKSGYLSHFEHVEIPLRVADASLTVDAETTFAEIRQMISSGEPVDAIRDRIVDLRGLMDEAERKLTDAGVGAPMMVMTQSFLILFREGFEVVLLLSVMLGYLEAAKSTRYLRPILVGVGLAVVATVLTVLMMPVLFSVLPINREVLEAITALVAVAVLFYVSFWLIQRLEQKRWMEFVRARLWSAISIGSTASLIAVGFTAVYREGFETALFYQSILSFGAGLGGYILLGVALAVVALAIVAWLVFYAGRRLPVRTFMNVAVAMVMATSVAFLGNAVHTLQAADVIPYHRLDGWPRASIFLAEATGYWPTLASVVAQISLTLVYLVGGLYTFVVRPRRAMARRPTLTTVSRAV